MPDYGLNSVFRAGWLIDAVPDHPQRADSAVNLNRQYDGTSQETAASPTHLRFTSFARFLTWEVRRSVSVSSGSTSLFDATACVMLSTKAFVASAKSP